MKSVICVIMLYLVSVCSAELRTWTAINGNKVEAEFVSSEKGVVKLKLKSGKVFEVSLNKLSKGDQEFLREEIKLKKSVAAQSSSPAVTQLERALRGKRIVLEAADYSGRKIEIPIVFPVGETNRTTGWLNRISMHRLEGFIIDGPPGGPIRLNLKPDTLQYSFDLNQSPNGSPLIGMFTFRSEDPEVGDNITLTTPQGVGRSIRDESINGDDKQELVITKIEHLKEVGGLYYKVADDNVTIIGCNPSISGKIRIPTRIDGASVTKIGKRAFGVWGGELKITDIILPPQLKEIEDEAFQGCTLIKDIEIPKSVTQIGSNAFRYCTDLMSVTIPASVLSLGEGAFEKCKQLTAATFFGDAPKSGGYIFPFNVTIYRKPEAKGWGDTFGDRPVKLISEKP